MQIGRFFSGWVGGLIGALGLVALGLLGWVLFAPPAGEVVVPPVPVATVPDTVAPTDDTGVSEPPQAPVAPVVAVEPEAAAAIAPVFDVVRIAPDGSALVAGRAEPGAAVSVLVEGGAVAKAEADTGAGFVAMFTLPPLDTDRVMTLEAVLADGTRLASEMNVIIEGVALPEVIAQAAPEPEPAPAPASAPEAVPAPVPVPAPTPAPAPAADATSAPEPGPRPVAEAEAAPDGQTEQAAAARPAPGDAGDAPEVAALAEAPTGQEPNVGVEGTPVQEPARPAAPDTATSPDAAEPPSAAPPAMPEAPRILLAGPDGVRVLQDTSPRPQLSIDAISYDDAGEVALAGRGQGSETLRIYLDNAPVGTAQVGPGGEWRAPLPDVDAGVYTLRVDSLSAEGEVTSRVETPFKREEPAILAAAGEKAAAAVAAGQTLSAITVQPGHTLWAIAEGRYGEGLRYWTIFRANSDQIRDPDWIYPGQVFTLPDAAQ